MPKGIKGFQQGNKLGGRPPKIKTQIKRFIEQYPGAVEELMIRLYQMGLKGDREACIYMVDRFEGKPRAATDINISGLETLGTATVREIFRIARGEVLELKEGEIALQGQGESQGVSEGETEEA